MGEDPGNRGPVAEEPKSPEELRREIEQTREELGDTAAALGAKADVKGRAHERVEEVKQNITGKKDEFAHKASVRRSAPLSGKSGYGRRLPTRHNFRLIMMMAITAMISATRRKRAARSMPGA